MATSRGKSTRNMSSASCAERTFTTPVGYVLDRHIALLSQPLTFLFPIIPLNFTKRQGDKR